MQAGLTTLARTIFAFAILAPLKVWAQQWNDPRTVALVSEAASRRASQLADTGLVDYSATAKGFVTFLAQLGEGFTEPPKVVRADELALKIYWRAPNLSKQRVYARRDTLLLPTDITYHRDHLGIIQNNFPNIIRLGDGDEVEDVPHPLSSIGLREYDFSIRDSLQIRLGPRTLNVYEVQVRPRDDRQARAVGAVFIDVESRDVVRMAFSFTRAALKDKDLDDVSVVLENGLFEGRFWLPRRQEIEIRRSGTWLDFPARGIIRGRWEICCYKVNQGIDRSVFAGPEIVILQSASTNKSAFSGKILDSLPTDVRAVTDEDVAKVQNDARALVREQALNRTKRTGLAGMSLSDFAQFNRVEGLALGAGLISRVGGGVSLPLYLRYGFSDREVKGSVGLVYERASGAAIRFALYRKYSEAGDEMERSRTINSFAAQEFGSDYTDLYDARGGVLRLIAPITHGIIPSAEFRMERNWSLEIHANSVAGEFEPAFPAISDIRESHTALNLDRPNRIGVLGLEIKGRLTLEHVSWRSNGCCVNSTGRLGRAYLSARIEHPFGENRLVLTSFAGVVRSSNVVPSQNQFTIGGPVTAPGYEFHSLAGTSVVSQRVEFRFPVSVPSFQIGRYGRSPAKAPLAPYLNLAGVSGNAMHLRPDRTFQTRGWFPSAGIGLLPIFELVRFDVARGFRNGRWSFSFDVSRDLWNIF